MNIVLGQVTSTLALWDGHGSMLLQTGLRRGQTGEVSFSW